MNTERNSYSQIGNTLRPCPADFFIMELSRPAPRKPLQDRMPLRRFLRLAAPDFAPLGNENMCVALWQLMARF